MHTHSHRRGRAGLRLALLALCISGLSAGCQSARPSYSFQPIHTSTAVVPPARRAASAPAPVVPPPPAGAAAVVMVAPVTQPQHRPRPVARPQAQAGFEPRTLAARSRCMANAPAPRLWQLRRRPQAPAEAGLGTTVLGLLGLVALPVALIGLALSGGGLVWAIIAGVAALAVVVALIDPDGR